MEKSTNPGPDRDATDAAILDALACEGTVADAAAAAGLSESAVHRRLQDRDFAEEVRRRTEAAAGASDVSDDELESEGAPFGSVATAKSTSAKQLAANRRNAQRSTGPRTDAGKTSSSRNAIRHGAYARHLYRIKGGVFEEEEDSLRARADAIVSGLGPRDAVEVEQADQVALAYVRLSRLDRFEASMLAETTTLSPQDRRFDDYEHARREVMLARQLGLVLLGDSDEQVRSDEGDASEFEWRELAIFVRENDPDPWVEVRGLWTDERTPASPEEWREVFRSLVARRWPDPQAALAWAEETCLELEVLEEEARSRVEAWAAAFALDEVLDRTVRLRQHALRELALALKTYGALKERPYPIVLVEDDLEPGS